MLSGLQEPDAEAVKIVIGERQQNREVMRRWIDPA